MVTKKRKNKTAIKDLKFSIKMTIQNKKMAITSYNQQLKEKKERLVELRRK